MGSPPQSGRQPTHANQAVASALRQGMLLLLQGNDPWAAAHQRHRSTAATTTTTACQRGREGNTAAPGGPH